MRLVINIVHIFYKSQILLLSVLKQSWIHYRSEKSWRETIFIVTYLHITYTQMQTHGSRCKSAYDSAFLGEWMNHVLLLSGCISIPSARVKREVGWSPVNVPGAGRQPISLRWSTRIRIIKHRVSHSKPLWGGSLWLPWGEQRKHIRGALWPTWVFTGVVASRSENDTRASTTHI